MGRTVSGLGDSDLWSIVLSSSQILSGSALAYYSSAYGEKNQDRQEYQKLRPLELYMGHSSPTKAPLVFPRRSRRRKQHLLPRGLKVKTISKYLNILFSFYVRPILSISLLVIGADMLHWCWDKVDTVQV